MTGTPVARPRGPRILPRLAVTAGLLAAVLVLLFYVGGGWFFSGLLYHDALS